MKRSRINPIGKIGKRWIEFRKQWLKDNPSKDGYYICAGCGYPVHEEEVVLDHILPRSFRPDLRFDPSNIQPMHWHCNSEKGSKHG